MNFEQFKEQLVKIEFIESADAFGHHPMQLVVIDADERMELNSLSHLGIQHIISRVKEYINNGSKDVFLSIDMPKGGDVENDFVLMVHFNNNKVVATTSKEYIPETGEVVKVIDDSNSSHIRTIVNYFTA